MTFETPYYLVDEHKLLKNLEKIRYLKDNAQVKSVLSLKCFSTWSLFKLIRQYMDGTSSSSLYEARLGYEKFGKEVHAYSVAFSATDILQLKKYANKIIFNSIAQLKKFYSQIDNLEVGIRLNPQRSYSPYKLADPAQRYSRLGITNYQSVLEVAELINGVMLHYNCDNQDFANFSILLDYLAETYNDLLFRLDWISLGGGIGFTLDNYPLEKFSHKLNAFGKHFKIQVYLEPGQAVITDSSSLVTTVLDIVHNERDIVIVDSSIEAHMLDLLVYQENAKIKLASSGKYHYIIAGKSCLAGDIFGEFSFNSPIKIGDNINFADAAGYTMVKTNWFNGLKMPSIIVRRLNGNYDVIKTFGYQDFKQSLG